MVASYRADALRRPGRRPGAAWWGWPARAEAAPYRANPDYRLRRLDLRWLWRRGCEFDQWPHTAIDDRTIIAGWGDGWGIQRPDGEPKSAIGFTRFTGGAAAPVVTDLWSDSQSEEIRALSLKPQALLTVEARSTSMPRAWSTIATGRGCSDCRSTAPASRPSPIR